MRSKLLHKIWPVVFTDTGALEWTCAFLLLVWWWWLILLVSHSSATTIEQKLGLFKLLGLPLFVFQVSSLLLRSHQRRRWAAKLSFGYWYLSAYIFAELWASWYFWFCAVLTAVSAYLIFQKSATEPKIDGR